MTAQDRRAAEELAESILRAAGSSLRHYTMPSGRQAILAAARAALQKARAEERERCARLCGEKASSFYDAHGNTSNSYDEGCSDCASDLEDAIRALR